MEEPKEIFSVERIAVKSESCTASTYLLHLTMNSDALPGLLHLIGGHLCHGAARTSHAVHRYHLTMCAAMFCSFCLSLLLACSMRRLLREACTM